MAILYFGRGNHLSDNYPAQKLDTASYSIYLWHWPVYIGMVLFGCATQPPDLWLDAGVLLLLGLLSWYAAENKLTVQINRLSGSLKQAGVSVGGVWQSAE